MVDSPSHVLPCALLSQPTPPKIPVEMISDEEMAIIEATFMAARPSIVACSSSSFSLLPSNIQRSPDSVGSLSVMSKSGYMSLAGKPDSVPDIEDSSQKARSPLRKKSRASQSLLDRFRRKGRLFVTDFTRADLQALQSSNSSSVVVTEDFIQEKKTEDEAEPDAGQVAEDISRMEKIREP